MGLAPSVPLMDRPLRAPSDQLHPELVEEIPHLPAWHAQLKNKLEHAQNAASQAIGYQQEWQTHYYDRKVRNHFKIKIDKLVWVSKIPRGPGITKFRHPGKAQRR